VTEDEAAGDRLLIPSDNDTYARKPLEQKKGRSHIGGL
jgi:hypothetical protein